MRYIFTCVYIYIYIYIAPWHIIPNKMLPYHLITVLIQISLLVFIMSIYIFGQMRTRKTHMGRRVLLFFLLLFQPLLLLLPFFFLTFYFEI